MEAPPGESRLNIRTLIRAPSDLKIPGHQAHNLTTPWFPFLCPPKAVGVPHLPFRSLAPHLRETGRWPLRRIERRSSDAGDVARQRGRPHANACRQKTHAGRIGATDGSLGQLPLSFEANEGQSDERVDFIARTGGYTAFLTPTGAVLSVTESASRVASATGETRPSPELTTGVALFMGIEGAAPQAAGGLTHWPGRSITSSAAIRTNGKPTSRRSAAWIIRTCIPALIWPTTARTASWSTISSSHLAPIQAAIALNFAGAEDIEINSHGDLVFHTQVGDLVQQKPFTYQEAGGMRHEIDSQYVLDGNRVSFEVGAYDENQPLVIDPLVLSYSTFLGGEDALAIGVDGARNAYVAGLCLLYE